MNPPRCSERCLRLLLIDRDRDTISGDLLEEYREVAVPALGPARARWWYRRQVAGIVWRSVRVPAIVGLVIGAALGALNLVDTWRRPLADDDGGTMLAWAVSLVVVWTAAALVLTRRTRRPVDAIEAGLVLGLATILVFDAAAIVRVNVFLDVVRHRDDWQNLVARYNASGFHSLRAYANYEYVRSTPLVFAIGALSGSISGALAAIVTLVARRATDA